MPQIHHFTDGCKVNNIASKQIVKTISKKIDSHNEIKVYPNPTQGIINVELPLSGNWQITASDITGRVIWQQSCTGCEGIIQHKIEGSKGMYFIKIINTFTGEQTIKKIILE